MHGRDPTGEENDFAGEEDKVLTVAQQSAEELYKELSGEYKDLLEICIGTHWGVVQLW